MQRSSSRGLRFAVILSLLITGAAMQASAEVPQPTPVLPAAKDDPKAAAPALEKTRKLHDITVLSETHYSIKRASLDKMLSDRAKLKKEGRIATASKGGKVIGIRLFGIRAASFFAALGFRNGDTIVILNGATLDSAETARAKADEARTAKRV